MSAERDTIFALSSGRPPAAIAVVRISGPHAGEALKRLSGRIPEPRKAALARIRDPQTNEPIDEALALWFPAPHSETGEDTAELQLHGGRAVIAATLAALGRIEDLRPAEAGEFTHRAFENGKLDLTAVEGLADLVMAETEGQRRQALRQMQGLLGNCAETWRDRLIRALALIEARIDFSDEADVVADLVTPALEAARALEKEIAAALGDGHRGERLREGLVVAIAGPPNVGKSTLLNRIARREAAIVSPYAGTTRDVIEVHLDLDGWPVTLLDTAGIRDSDNPVEIEGMRRAQERAVSADLVLWVVDAMGAGQEGAGESRYGGALWQVRNKIDVVEQGIINNEFRVITTDNIEPSATTIKPLTNIIKQRLRQRNESDAEMDERVFNISAATGEGLDHLLSALSAHAERVLSGGEQALVTRERHRGVLENALAALRRALAPDLAGRDDLLAEEFRAAAQSLGRITGQVDVEDILDVIFRDFCIGK